MGIRERLSGNEAVAYAMKQINPDVMGAYPITPSTEIPQYFSTYVDNGEVDTEFIEDMKASFQHKFASKPQVIEGNMRALKRSMEEVQVG